MLLMCISSILFGRTKHFCHKNLYTKARYSSKVFLPDFWDIFLPFIRKYFKQFSTKRVDIFQNVLILLILLISVDQNIPILFMNNIYIGNIRTLLYRKILHEDFFFYLKFFFNKHTTFHYIKLKLKQNDINKKNVT